MRSLHEQLEEANSARLRAMLTEIGRVGVGDAKPGGPVDQPVPSAPRGRIDEANRVILRGWAIDDAWPDRPVSLLVILDGALLGRVVANGFRQDLRDAGLGDGRNGFELRFEPALSPLRAHQIRVLHEDSGLDVARSPVTVEAASRLDETELGRLGTLLMDGLDGDTARVDRRIAMLAEQLDRLLDVRAAGPVTTGRHASGDESAASIDVRPGADDRPVALVIDEVMPDAARDAGSNAVLSHMRALLRLGFRVVFGPADRRCPPCLADAMAADGIELSASPFSASVEETLRRHGDTVSVVYLHRGSIGSRYARLVRHACPSAQLIVSIADLQGVRLRRQAAAEQREELLAPARRGELQDLDAMTQADIVLTHSTVEAAAIKRALPGKPVRRILWTPRAGPVSTPFLERNGVAFLADYAHAPNLEAARRLIDEIMPLVWQHEPDLPCLLAGSRLPHGFGAGKRRVIWIGHVPVLQSLFERVRLTVAPLSFGAGVKGKVLESLAAGVPCVCSSIAAEGLALPSPLDMLVADDTHGIARRILNLHRDPSSNRAAASAGLAWAAAALSEQRLDDDLRDVVSSGAR